MASDRQETYVISLKWTLFVIHSQKMKDMSLDVGQISNICLQVWQG